MKCYVNKSDERLSTQIEINLYQDMRSHCYLKLRRTVGRNSGRPQIKNVHITCAGWLIKLSANIWGPFTNIIKL